MASGFSFVLNGRPVTVSGASTNQSLLSWLRANGHTGSKEGCAEGDCGACTVAFVERDAAGRTTYRAINSCITLVPMVAGREVVTVEGLARASNGSDGTPALHPVQDAMVQAYGSQCGYCTPGFVVSMFEAYYRTDLGETETEQKRKIGDQLNGNLCRCTGYRPIREAMMDALSRKKTSTGEDLFELRLKKAPTAAAALTYTNGEQVFHRPTSLRALLELRNELPAAELVCGATEIGVYINKRGTSYPALVSTEAVAELSEIKKTDDAWTIGGAASLTSVEEALAGEYPMIDKMLWVFASRQIRSRASIAGNIVTASPIGDTPPLLLALDAEVHIESVRGKRTVPIAEFFTGYRKTVLLPDEIVVSVRIPRGKGDAHTRLSNSYKVSKRRELDISIAAAAFVVDLDASNVVLRARLAYGGVAATPARAKKAEALLVGQPWNEATMQHACTALREEFTPLSDVRSGKDFRVGLVVSLFEKFFRGDESEAQDKPLLFDDADGDAAVVLTAPRSLKHESARGHVTGGARYVDDDSRRRPMLEMWPVVSKVAAGKITRIDTKEAEAMPGVRCVLTANDIPGENDIGAVRKDEPLLAATDVRFHSQMIAMVVADTYEQARLAAAKVIVDVEETEAVLGIPDAIAKGSYHTEPHVIRRGDFASALAAAPLKVSGEFACGGQEHFYLEAQAAWAECGDDGDVFVASSTQHPSEIQAVVSHVMHIPRNKVTVQAPRMGGGFGGKETQGNGFAALAVLAAKKTGKAVRIQLDRDIDMMLTGKRHPFHFRYEAGFETDGRLVAAKVLVVNDGGYALDLSESICDRALFHLDNAYFIPNVHFEGRVAKTHAVSHTAFRGFGGPQGMLAMEDILDRGARALNLRPEVVRERNLYRGVGESNTTHYGQALDDERMPQIWKSLLGSSAFEERRTEIAVWNAKSPKIKRGLAITPMKFGISFTATFLNQAGALVLVYRDGTVQVNHGGTEMGQGLYTKMLGVAMRSLGVSEGRIRIMRTQTDKVPNTSATAASSGSDLNGQAVKHACDQIRERLVPVATAMLAERSGKAVAGIVFENDHIIDEADSTNRVPFEAVVEKAYFQQVSLSATGFYRTPGIGYDKGKGKGKPFYYFAYGAAVSEVEVDGYSGMKRVLRVDILTDVGESLNPGVDRGQIEGAFVQGVGWLTSEELKWDPKGRLLTHSASTYQIPAIGDAPKDFRVELLKNAAQDGVIYGSKAVGEPPLMLAMSVREAIRDAIAAFGTPGGEVALPSPATHEAIYAAVQARSSARVTG